MTDDFSDLSIILGEGLVQAIPDLDLHG
jgi:hypothetical protein